MKKLLFYIMACALLMCACDLNSDSSQQSEDEQQVADSTQIDQQSGDSIDKSKDMTGQIYVKMIDLTASVKEVRSQLDGTKIQIGEINKVVEAKVGQTQFTILLGGFVLLFIVIIFLLYQVNKLQKHHHHVVDAINKIGNQMNLLRENQKYAQPSSSVTKRDLDTLYTSLNKIDSRMKAVETAISKQSSTTSIGGQQPQRYQQRGNQIHQHKEENTVWFGVNTRNLFPNTLDAGDVHIAFKGVYRSDNEVEFEPVSWERIKSFNDLSDVVTVQGNREGSSMHINRPGRAKKQSEDGRVYWQVTSPALITIS